MRLAVVGASGRMGRSVVRLAAQDGIEIVCAVSATDVGKDVGDLAGVGPLGISIVDSVGALQHARADVVVDFSAPAATLAFAPIAAAAGTAIVSGTTGLGSDAAAALRAAATRVPVLAEPNMSVGIYVLSQIVARAAAMLEEWDLEIVEVHHRAKEDAPSGTALRLAEVAQRGRTAPMRLVHGRQGKPGARKSDQIGMHAVRGGDTVGDHTVHLMGGGERLELTHRATSRDVFAHGALRAARWLVGKPASFYALGDVLSGGQVN
jgi:4-hydroxy-tetrahydrodipicolinate reductase